MSKLMIGKSAVSDLNGDALKNSIMCKEFCAVKFPETVNY